MQQVLLPITTLVLGYALSLVASAIDSRRSEKRRRIADKERAYVLIFAKLHQMFEAYRRITLTANMDRMAGVGRLWSLEDNQGIAAYYDELEAVVFEQSLFLSAENLQRLLDLKLTDVRGRFRGEPTPAGSLDDVTCEEQRVDRLWSEAKAIMSDMRTEIGLDPYPEDVLKMWR